MSLLHNLRGYVLLHRHAPCDVISRSYYPILILIVMKKAESTN
jgi:hypothetical protein